MMVNLCDRKNNHVTKTLKNDENRIENTFRLKISNFGDFKGIKS